MSHTNGCSNPNCYLTKDCGHVAAAPVTSTAAELIEEARVAAEYLDAFDARRKQAGHGAYPAIPEVLAAKTLQGTFRALADALEAATNEPETMPCPECAGVGGFNVTFVFGDQRMLCEDCDGTGQVPAKAPETIEFGTPFTCADLGHEGPGSCDHPDHEVGGTE